MAESDLHHFTVRLMHAPQVQSLPDEIAYTYPIPLKNHHVAVYAYLLRGLPPASPKVSPPERYLEAVYPSAQIVQFRPIGVGELGVPLLNDGTLGTVSFPPEYANIDADEFNKRQEYFEEAYSRAISAYLTNAIIEPATANQVLAQLPVFGKKPLLPVYRVTNPDFFSWLEKNARR